MTPELWQRLKPLFHEALSLAGDDRVAFIEKACRGDAELKDNLIRLVQAGEERTGTLGRHDGGPAANHRYRFHVGETILDRFHIVRMLGRGGMGEVYEAEDLELGRIALKAIRDDFSGSPIAFQRFRQEVQLARRVTGPEVCRIHELYLLPASGLRRATAFLTMEFLEGTTLADRLNHGGPMSAHEALPVALDICEGIRLIHSNGIIHRDLKSANIMLCGKDKSQRAVLMDFGLARDFSRDAHSGDAIGSSNEVDQTQPGALMGTPAYMAPEQFEGKPVSPQTDIYALGVVLYELVTGLHPFAAPTPVAAASRRAHRPAMPSTLNRAIPRKWDRIIRRCLEYDPEDRFHSAVDVLNALRTGPVAIDSLRYDHPWIVGIAGAAVVALIAWSSILLWQILHYYHPRNDVKAVFDDGMREMWNGQYVLARLSFEEAIRRDPQFDLAHARLAEALYDLDLQDNAQKHLLTAIEGRDLMAPLDRLYLDAIQATVSEKFPNSISIYHKILRQLPLSMKSQGSVDLGMAYERDGDINNAIANYKSAASEDIDNPSAYMHEGILLIRQGHEAEANEAFDHAQAIFQRTKSTEGQAELDYERGYAANTRGLSKDAEQFLLKALNAAKAIPSAPLEIRTLMQLSSAEYGMKNQIAAKQYADEAIAKAHDSPLETWMINGWVRIAIAELATGHPQNAEEPLNKATELLHEYPQPRAEALAKITLAGVKIQEGLPDEAVGPAQSALNFYEKNGFYEGAAKARLIMIQVDNQNGQYMQALHLSQGLIVEAEKSGNVQLQIQAHEAEGTAYFGLEQYPKSLQDYKTAKDLAALFVHLSDNPIYQSYEAANYGDILWRLNRYAESQAALNEAAKEPLLNGNVAASRVEGALSQLQFQTAMATLKTTAAESATADPDERLELKQDELIAASHLGMKSHVLRGLAAVVSPPDHSGKPEKLARDNLALAEIYLDVGMNQLAFDAATTAEGYFSSSGQLDSDLRCACLAEKAASALRRQDAQGLFSEKIIDIQNKLTQNWGLAAYQQYISRPDLHLLTSDSGKTPNRPEVGRK